MLKKKMEGEGESNKQGTKRSEEGERFAEDGEEDVEVHCKDRQVAEPEEKTNMMVMIKMMDDDDGDDDVDDVWINYNILAEAPPSTAAFP